MASPLAIAIQCDTECARIEERIYALTGLDLTPLPRIHKDHELLRRDQLHTIADWLDRVPDNATLDATDQDNDLLAQVCELVASGKWTKPQLEALLGLGAAETPVEDDNGSDE